jgi:predicted RecA/RadA family phage recombinase
VEEVSSVAMAVQNMHHGAGAYWSSGVVHAANETDQSNLGVVNPNKLNVF